MYITCKLHVKVTCNIHVHYVHVCYMYITCILHVQVTCTLCTCILHVYYMYITCPISDHTVPVSIFDVRLHWVQLFFETPATKILFDSVFRLGP